MNREELFWSRHTENEEFESVMADIIFSGGLVLDVGCGGHKIHPSLMGVDAYSTSAGVNVQAYMWDMPFEAESVDGLFCFMALEHVSKFQVMPILAEFNRVLKKEAQFIILVPDLLWVLEAFISNPTHDWEMDMLFGTQENDGEYHKTGFTEDILRKYFTEAIPNCSIDKVCSVNAYNQMSIGLIATKH